MQRPPASHAYDKDGLLLRRDAVRIGIDDKALARLVDGNVIVRLRQGIYCDRAVWLSAGPGERHRLLSTGVMRLYDEHVALANGSACIAQGGPSYGLDLTSVHITHLTGNGRRKSRIRHHSGVCLVGDLRRHDGYWITTPARSIADVVRTDGVLAGLVQANYFLHRGLVSKDELRSVFARTHNWPGSLQQHPVLYLADARIESVGETRCDYEFFRQGLPRPVPQYEILDQAGNLLYRVDFAWPELGVIVEFDGAEKYHSFRRPGESIEDMVLREKAREDHIRELTGWTVIRLTWKDLDLPIHTANRIRQQFTRRAASDVRPASGF